VVLLVVVGGLVVGGPRGGKDILDIPPLITLADMDKSPGRFEGSLQDMAK